MGNIVPCQVASRKQCFERESRKSGVAMSSGRGLPAPTRRGRCRRSQRELKTMPGIKAGSPKSPSPSKKGKGKQRATPPASSSPRKEATAADSPAAGSKRARTAQTGQMQAASSDNELLELAQRIADNAHLLVRGAGSDDIAEQARNTLKRSFDKGA